jgi:hypothetical protein
VKLPQDGALLRIFIGETDHWHGRPLHEAIVLKAREMHLAGATVLKGIMGYGASSRLHTTKLLRLSEDLPVIVEIVDTRAKLETLMPFLEEAIQDGLVTIENVQVIRYGANSDKARSQTGGPS